MSRRLLRRADFWANGDSRNIHFYPTFLCRTMDRLWWDKSWWYTLNKLYERTLPLAWVYFSHFSKSLFNKMMYSPKNNPTRGELVAQSRKNRRMLGKLMWLTSCYTVHRPTTVSYCCTEKTQNWPFSGKWYLTFTIKLITFYNYSNLQVPDDPCRNHSCRLSWTL